MKRRLAVLGCTVLWGAGCDLVLGLDHPPVGGGGAGAATSSGDSGTTGGGGTASACTKGETKACYSGPAGTKDVGTCKGGTQNCKEDESGFGPCDGEVLPATEICHNTQDENCDGVACAALLSSTLWGDAENQTILDVGNDAEGNIVLLGKFSGELKFTAPTLFAGNTVSLFSAKLDGEGFPIWSVNHGTIGDVGDGALSVAPSGEIAVGGLFTGTIGGFGVDPLTGTGKGYVGRLTKDGGGVWGRKLDCSPFVRPHAITFDGGEVLLAGDFQCDIDFGAGVQSSQAGYDVFVAALASPMGNATWSRQFGNVQFQTANAAVGLAGGLTAVVGLFQGMVDFDGTAATADMNMTPDLFLITLNTDGAVVFVRSASGAHYHQDLTANGLGNVIVAGWFSGATNLGGDDLAGATGSVLVAKLTSTLDHVWSTAFGGPNFAAAGDIANALVSVSSDAKGNTLLAVRGKGTIDFGGGELGAAGEVSEFLVKLDQDGKHVWSKRFGPVGDTGVCAVAVGKDDAPVIGCGIDAPSIDFGNGALEGKGGSDVVVARFAP